MVARSLRRRVLPGLAAHRFNERGLSAFELLVAVALIAAMLVAAFTSFRKYNDRQNLKYAVVQVASGLRQGEERAKAERTVYTVAFGAGASTYAIARSSGGFLENASLPGTVTPQATDTVTFSAFGIPDAAHTITLQNAAGAKTVSVDTQGGITYSP